MKVELHLHTLKKSGCALAWPRECMLRLIEEGYGAVFITEHDAIWTRGEIEALQAQFPAIRIFPGMELSFPSTSHHLLVLGTSDPQYLHLAGEHEVFRKARAEGHLTVLAHPFRYRRGHEILFSDELPDAIEYHTSNQNAQNAQKAREAADGLGLPFVNAGDVHALDAIGMHWIETSRPLDRAEELRPLILEGAYENRSAPG